MTRAETVIAYAAAALVAFIVLKRAGAAVVTAVNPTDPNNLANQAANVIYHGISGNNVDTIGTWLYGILHPAYNPNAPAPDAAPAWGGASGGW